MPLSHHHVKPFCNKSHHVRQFSRNVVGPRDVANLVAVTGSGRGNYGVRRGNYGVDAAITGST